MDGLCRVIGAGVDCTLAGQTYLLSPLTLLDLGIIEHHLLAARRSPLEAVQEALPTLQGYPDLQRELVARAERDMREDTFSNKIRRDRLAAWLDSEEGVLFTAWLCLRKQHPTRFETLQQAEQVLRAANPEERREFIRRRDLISGMDRLAALDWPAPADSGESSSAETELFPWRRWMRAVLENYPGQTEEDAGKLTEYQARVRVEVAESEEGPKANTMQLNPDEAREYLKLREHDPAAAKAMLQRLRKARF